MEETGYARTRRTLFSSARLLSVLNLDGPLLIGLALLITILIALRHNTFFRLVQHAELWIDDRTPAYWSAIAKELRRAIQQFIDDPLSERILTKEFHAGEIILADIADGELVFRSMPGIEPPPAELAGTGPADAG